MLLLMTAGNQNVWHSDGLKWYNVYSKFHELINCFQAWKKEDTNIKTPTAAEDFIPHAGVCLAMILNKLQK